MAVGQDETGPVPFIISRRKTTGACGWWKWSIKPEPEGHAAATPGGNGVHENGANDDLDAAGQVMPAETAAAGAEQPEPEDEFGGDRFQRIFRAAVIATLNRKRAAELSGTASNGKKGKNGKGPKPR